MRSVQIESEVFLADSQYGNATWFRGGRWGDTAVALSGIAGNIHARQMVNIARQTHEILRNKSFEVVVSMRPDIYERVEKRYNGVQVKAPSPQLWGEIVDKKAVRSGAVYPCGCAHAIDLKVGGKSADMCFLASPATMDRVMAAWTSQALLDLNAQHCASQSRAGGNIGDTKQCIGSTKGATEGLPEDILKRSLDVANIQQGGCMQQKGAGAQ